MLAQSNTIALKVLQSLSCAQTATYVTHLLKQLLSNLNSLALPVNTASQATSTTVRLVTYAFQVQLPLSQLMVQLARSATRVLTVHLVVVVKVLLLKPIVVLTTINLTSVPLIKAIAWSVLLVPLAC